MYGLPPQIEHAIEEQVCRFWLRDDFSAWAAGAGFMEAMLGHGEVRDMLKWLVSVRILKAEGGNWDELPTR